MNIFALALAVTCALASIGLAAWIGLALESGDEGSHNLTGFDGIHCAS